MMYILRIIAECETPFHCGSGDDDPILDAPVVRDAFGLWTMPGSSIAGTLRAMAARIGGEAAAGRLFGEDSRETTPSLVWCSDGVLLDFDGIPTRRRCLAGETPSVPTGPYLRDHVRINANGAAADGGKFDEEIVPPGARFAFELTYDEWNGGPDEQGRELFLSLASLLNSGGCAFGGRLASGYGRLRTVDCQCRQFDLSTEEGMTAWLNLGDTPLFGDGDGRQVTLPASVARCPSDGISGSIVIPLVLDATLLVGGPAGIDDTGSPTSEVDMNCLTVPFIDYGKRKVTSRLVLPGTSVKGVIAHRVAQIVRLVGHKGEEESVCRELFGEVCGRDGGTPGRVIFHDRMFSAPLGVVQHVAVDRFTGGTMPGALFDEAPVWQSGLELPLQLELDGIGDRPAAFLLHALLDLVEGCLAVGGGTNRGNGRLRLKDVGNGASALAGIVCDLHRGRSVLRTGDQAEARQWLDILENALHHDSKEQQA